MKRFFLLLLIPFLLCSCSDENSSVRLNRQSFSTGFKATYNSIELSGTVSLKDGIRPEFIIREPEELQGCEVLCDEHGVEFKKRNDYSDDIVTKISTKNPFSDVYDAINGVSDDTILTKNDNGFFEYACDNYKIVTDARGNIVRLTTKYIDISFI